MIYGMQNTMKTKYIFITGGVVSSLGKGIVAASLGMLLRSSGYSVSIQKCDPYMNVDPGNMSPFEHGEVFVTEDGAETDLDLGHYERFIDENLNKNNSITAGSIYLDVILKERNHEYLGATVQTIPHITDEIKHRIQLATNQSSNDNICNKKYHTDNNHHEGYYDFVIVEIGGTIGDIESLPFIEAIRQFKIEYEEECSAKRVIFIHVTLLPYLATTGELKTKPSQHSVITLRGLGIQPDILICRCQTKMSSNERNKLALFTNINNKSIIECSDATTIYEVPILLEQEGIIRILSKHLEIEETSQEKIYIQQQNFHASLLAWQQIVHAIKHPQQIIKIAIIGKYNQLSDAYISIVEALKHAALNYCVKVEFVWINSDECISEEITRSKLAGVAGIVVPGGFGTRGIEGKIHAITVARTDNIPFLGLCLGLQCAVIEYSRNVIGIVDADSIEFNINTTNPVIHLIHATVDNSMQNNSKNNYVSNNNEQLKYGYMRLGAHELHLDDQSLAKELYQQNVIVERHRHRYTVNNDYKEQLIAHGLRFSGISTKDNLIEIIELERSQHKYFIACQFHPEFKSRPNRPHPLFCGLINASIH